MIRLSNRNIELRHEEDANTSIWYTSTDDKETFKKNKTILGKDWKYYDNPILYKFNSSGYRTKEISELSNKFMLVFGCSYTEGIGLHTEDIWTHHVSTYLQHDLYNHAKGGTGMDIQYYNGTLWNMSRRSKPELVIAQWPYKFRKSFGYRDGSYINILDPTETNNLDDKWWKKRYINDTGEMELNILNWFENFNNTWKLAGVPVLNFTWDSDLAEHLTRSRYQIHRIKPKNHDKARDCQHDGELFHKETADIIKNLLCLPNFTDKI